MQSAPARQPLQWLRLPDLITRRRRSRSATYRDIEDGLFPPPVRLGANSSVWPEFEVDAIDRARLAGASDDDIRALVAQQVQNRKAAA
ncbi:helix-turn-helix transcriptional regulator [Dokdonella immobilis]|uniref:Transcriptional regulator, AlpA family n=1 Tax=Dokdonella immobilis TaxID=578942 RepID=A0A1I4VVG6_9GAMM|nr:AlpA family phage regulatory protein [Dokdonella immobilis]SFN05007.1 transcriptional regulator, AlpA family [Dokdonella immobilis]